MKTAAIVLFVIFLGSCASVKKDAKSDLKQAGKAGLEILDERIKKTKEKASKALDKFFE